MRTLIAILVALCCSFASAGEVGFTDGWGGPTEPLYRHHVCRPVTRIVERPGRAIFINGRFVGVTDGANWYEPSQVIWERPRYSPPVYVWPEPRGRYGFEPWIQPMQPRHQWHDLDRWNTDTGFGDYR